ncbi:U6 snRNA-associated Sm-like protein LSm1 [Catharus ustulatus]|uniref:U6 snRNA-associated Sm-like protein LSm1 n=1 Tax=Catharus ustulatus TaxID=91951 RepID=UPI00140AC18E|nr:U6 snRNA-associated Sm-like protein LSm1 [Catharus ustulatus]
MNYMPGTASLIQDIDKKHLVLLRDGRTLIGYLRSIDQFANLVLHQTVERIHVGKKYGDIPRGIFVVRGENVVLLGEIVSAQLPLQPGPELVCPSVCLKYCCSVGLELELPPGPVQAEPSQKCQPAGQGFLLLPQLLWVMGRMKKNAEGAVGKPQIVWRVALLAVTSLLALHQGTPSGMGSGGAEPHLGSPGAPCPGCAGDPCPHPHP